MRPAGDFTIFTLFPWAGFVFAGGAVGALIAAARDERAERRLHIVLGAAGAALIALGFYTAGLPSIYASSSFWTSSPTWFAIRVGILMVALSAIYASSRCAANTAVATPGCVRAIVRRGSAARRSAAARCSSTGFTSSWSTATRAGCGGTACRSGAPPIAYIAVLCADVSAPSGGEIWRLDTLARTPAAAGASTQPATA